MNKENPSGEDNQEKKLIGGQMAKVTRSARKRRVKIGGNSVRDTELL